MKIGNGWNLSAICSSLGKMRYPPAALSQSILLVMCITLIPEAQAARTSTPTSHQHPRLPLRLTLLLNGAWQKAVAITTSRPPATGWHTIYVPETAFAAGEDAVWYRTSFPIPSPFADPPHRFLLTFERIRHRARFWLNGKQCGEHHRSRVPITLDVTKYIEIGSQNRLEILVQNSTSIPRQNPTDTIPSEAINRIHLSFLNLKDKAYIAEDVRLEMIPLIHIRDAIVLPSVTNKTIRLHLDIENTSPRDTEIAAHPVIRSAGSNQVEIRFPPSTLTIAAGHHAPLTWERSWPEAIHWGYPPYGKPHLYFLDTELHISNTVIDRFSHRFGFREISFHENQLYFNGKPWFPFGARVNENNERSALIHRIFGMQQSGFNCIQTHCEARTQSFYDVCDEMGMPILASPFCGGPMGANLDRNIQYEDYPDLLADMESDYTAWVRSARSHPSICLWSTGCNIPGSWEDELFTIIRSEDATRPIVSNNLFHADSAGGLYKFGLGLEHNDTCKAVLQHTDLTLAATLFKRHPGWIPLFIEIGIDESEPANPISTTRLIFSHLRANHAAGGFLFINELFQSPIDTLLTPWPALSGLGTRTSDRRLQTDIERINIWDSTFPAWRIKPSWQGLPLLSHEILGYQTGNPLKRMPELLVSLLPNRNCSPGQWVWTQPADHRMTTAIGAVADNRGRAWIVLQEPGEYVLRTMIGKQLAERKIHVTDGQIVNRGGFDHLVSADLDLSNMKTLRVP